MPHRNHRFSELERFLMKVHKTETCWLWTGAKNSLGYGSFFIRPARGVERNVSAHRYGYRLWIGPIPVGLTLDHLCRVKHCVNPAHLEPVTMRVNILRSNNACAKNARKTHCQNGHKFDEANTAWHNYGRQRACLTCQRIAMRRREREKVEAGYFRTGPSRSWVLRDPSVHGTPRGTPKRAYHRKPDAPTIGKWISGKTPLPKAIAKWLQEDAK